MKWHQKSSPRSPKAHQMGTKLMPKRSKIPKMTPGGKIIIFLYEFGPIQGARSAPFSVQNPIKSFKKAVRKSTLEKYHQMMLKSWKNSCKWWQNPIQNIIKIWSVDFCDFIKSITYFCYFTTSGRSKTVDILMESYDRLPVVKNDGNTIKLLIFELKS